MPAPAVATDHHLFTCPQDIGGTGDAINGALSRAVAIIKQILGLGIIYRNYGIL